MTLVDIYNLILTGFFFATGVILAWAIFQLLMLYLQRVFLHRLYKKYMNPTKKSQKKPEGMEFGKFTD